MAADVTTTIDSRRRLARAVGEVAAPPPEVFGVLTDPSLHPVLDGSDTVVAATGLNPDELELGSRFFMLMRWTVVPYPILNRVVEYERDRRIAWRHFAGHRWRWELDATATGTRVAHTFDWSTSHWPRALELVSYPERNAAGMARSVERLEDYVAARRPAG